MDYYPCDTSIQSQLPDRVDFIFNPVRWPKDKNEKSKVYIAVKNVVEEDVSFSIQLREYLHSDTYCEKLKSHVSIFDAALDGSDAHALSFAERNISNDHDDKGFTYGEVI